LLQEVLDQLYKDFNADTTDFAWGEGPNAYVQFVKSLEDYLGKIYQHDMGRLKSLLYRVDVSERKLNRVWVQDETDHIGKLTGLILDRELQKVLTRRMFRNK
jgi:SPX domain protein involved in polyphosphate accumulation